MPMIGDSMGQCVFCGIIGSEYDSSSAKSIALDVSVSFGLGGCNQPSSRAKMPGAMRGVAS